MKLWGKGKPPEEPITLALPDWQPLPVRPGDSVIKAWRNAAGDVLTLNHFAKPPDIGAPLTSLDALRAFYRQSLGQNAGLIDLNVVELEGIPSVRLILKVPQSPHGMIYVGSYTIPKRAFSYVVKFQCHETGTTGIRDSVVLDKLLGSGAVTIGSDGEINGWTFDPYDPGTAGGVLMNRSEEAKYDRDFPNHPLTRLRRAMAETQQTIRLSQAVKDAPRFIGSAGW